MQNREEQKEVLKALVKISRYAIYISMFAVGCIAVFTVVLFGNFHQHANNPVIAQSTNYTDKNSIATPKTSTETNSENRSSDVWKAPEESTIPAGKEGEKIRFGRELIAHTAEYFGPKGSIAQISNMMNCQNCHLDAGTRLFANDYASFISSYPKKSNRSGKVEPASERIVECFERSMNGKAPDTASKPVQAILAYMKWLGKDVPKGAKLYGSATEKLAFMDVSANPEKGKAVFVQKCQSCHGNNGQGVLSADQKSFIYPPLWGKNSYNDGAGMYRIGNFAGFVKNNMPYGATYQNPQLTDEEAWNVAAFVNSRPRPHRDQHKDWKNLLIKPIDFPFGPYADHFSEEQHKFGPFKPIKEALQKLNIQKSQSPKIQKT